MSTPLHPVSGSAIPAHDEPLAARIARWAVLASAEDMHGEVTEKVKLCLLDLIGCAFEARELPWSQQARQIALRVADGATIIGTPFGAAPGDAAFANAVMAHGLVREDMHPGSISHLGIVILPTLLALAQYRRVAGRNFVVATAVGYEVGGQLGNALIDSELARIHRPTGVTGPVAAAAAGARALGLGVEQATSAIALASNTTIGFNQWAHTGGSEMFFHAGFAAREAVTAVRLGELGAFASPSALDGEAGLFAAFGKRSSASNVRLFQGRPEILSVFHKPVPACNFAQTACQAAVRIARVRAGPLEHIASIVVRVPRAGVLYPGCDFRGPFAQRLQAKMSIQFNVAAALVEGDASEENFTRLNDPRVHRLIRLMRLEVDEEMTKAYPARQGGEVEVEEIDASTHRVRLEDVVRATPSEVRERFRAAAERVCGARRAREIESCVDELERTDDAGRLAALLRTDARSAGLASDTA